jgi:hypothetical protein
LAILLSEIPRRRLELAWKDLRQRGVTHALVHEAAYLEGDGVRVSTWLGASGAAEIFRDGSDALFALPKGSSVVGPPSE